MIVEDQQIGAVVDRRASVSGNQLPAEHGPIAPVVRGHYGKSRALPCGAANDFASLLLPDLRRQNAKVAGIGQSVDGPHGIMAPCGQILKLHGSALGNPENHQAIMQRRFFASQAMFHEDLADDGIDERRMYAVAAEVTGPGKPGREGLQSVQPAFDISSVDLHDFSMPARRPVEKAIWRL